jgi:prolyl 4-hydroxylase
VISAIINVDQDLDEPWPLEVYGRDGKAVNITMVAGDMVLYESHSIIHGRPFPLKGRFMANLFAHFEPIGGPLTNDKKSDTKIIEDEQSIKQQETVGDIPPYIIPGTQAAEEWLETNWEPRSSPLVSFTDGTTYAHYAAKEGALDQLILEVEQNESVIHEYDEEGYTPLLYAIQLGHLHIAQFLISKGADKDVPSRNIYNATALWWAKMMYTDNHPMVQYLLKIGALDMGPDL